MPSTSLTRRNIQELVERSQRALSRARGVVATAEKKLEHGITSVETAGTAFAVGFIDSKWKKSDGSAPTILGVEIALLLAGVGHVMGYLGSQTNAKHFHSIGDGGLCAFAYKMGVKAGQKTGSLFSPSSSGEDAPYNIPVPTGPNR